MEVTCRKPLACKNFPFSLPPSCFYQAALLHLTCLLIFCPLSFSFIRYGKMGIRPGKAMLQQLERQVIARVEELAAPDVVKVMSGYAKVGYVSFHPHPCMPRQVQPCRTLIAGRLT
jgi:hypothetical protein